MSRLAIAALESLRSTGSAPSISNHALTKRPLSPGSSKYSFLARKATGRGTTIGITMLSTKLRWLLARITGPAVGTRSSPVTVGRHTALPSGGMTECRNR